jgi:hypothetical protein
MTKEENELGFGADGEDELRLTAGRIPHPAGPNHTNHSSDGPG